MRRRTEEEEEKRKLDLTEKPVRNQLRIGRMSFPDRCDDRRDSAAAAGSHKFRSFPDVTDFRTPLSFT